MTSYYRQHFSIKHALIASLSRIFANYVYTQRHGLIPGMKRRGGLGFLPAFLAGRGESAELCFFRNLDLRDAVVHDIGGYQGILTLFFPRQARQVVTDEANPVTASRLKENLALNRVSNVTVRELGVGDLEGPLVLTFDNLMTGAASGDDALSRQTSQSSARTTSVSTRVVRLDDDIACNHLPPPAFIKIDIEGMGLPALRGAIHTLQTHGPALYPRCTGPPSPKKNSVCGRSSSF